MENTISFSINLRKDFDPNVIGKALALLISQTAEPMRVVEAIENEMKLIRAEPSPSDLNEELAAAAAAEDDY